MKKEKFSAKEIGQLNAILTKSIGEELEALFEGAIAKSKKNDVWPVCLNMGKLTSSHVTVTLSVLPSLPPAWVDVIKKKGKIKTENEKYDIFINQHMGMFEWESCMAIIAYYDSPYVVIVPSMKFVATLINDAVENLIKIFDASNKNSVADNSVNLAYCVDRMRDFTEKRWLGGDVYKHNSIVNDCAEGSLIPFTAGLMSFSGQTFDRFELKFRGKGILHNVYLASSFSFTSLNSRLCGHSFQFIPTELLHELEDMCGRLKVMDLRNKLKLAEQLEQSRLV